MILLDLSKDVDSIDHLILFRKLQLISVSMDSFKSYQSDRTHCVRTGSTTSQAHTVTRGASQGSILGSLLLNIYINDVPNVTKEPRLESYTWMILKYFYHSQLWMRKVQLELSEDMNRISICCCSNNLLVNPGKTKFLLIGTQQMLERLPEKFHTTVFDKEIRL